VIRFEAVTKRFPLPGGAEHLALDRLDLEVRESETLCLIGGSGCGKTTTLRLVNRMVEPSSGRVLVGGEDVAGLDPVRLRRSMGYVVQRGALFPHLTVRENIGLLCRLEGWSRDRTRARTDELLDMVQLPAVEFAERYPAELSGGQQQRVGVARALALDPPIVLLDEPFGALDPPTRRQLQQEFRDLRRVKQRTVVLVTHDLDEAFVLGDRVALLEAGRLLQVGTPEDLRDRPADERVAAFVAHHAPGGLR
jgi:osmoprotectant transport system ATP-binding protein